MPTDDGVRRHNLHRLPPGWPDAREKHPEQPIDPTEARSFRGGPFAARPADAGAREFLPRARAETGWWPEARPNRAMNSAVMVPENAISLRSATATATTRTKYSVGTAVSPVIARRPFEMEVTRLVGTPS